MTNLENNPSLQFRSILMDVLEDRSLYRKNVTLTETVVLLNEYKPLIDSINGFIVVCDYTTGQYEYVSKGIRSHLGYDLEGYTKEELTNFIFSVIYERHQKFLLNSLLPTVFTYFKENSTIVTGMDYRFTCCLQVKNIYNTYMWYLIDTIIIAIDDNGFPLKTLITCTDIDKFKKDDRVYFSILKKNKDSMYEVMMEGSEDESADEHRLTPREIEVINLISRGYTNKQIADKLCISLNTVQTHRKNLIKKTKCNGIAALTNFAFIKGLL